MKPTALRGLLLFLSGLPIPGFAAEPTRPNIVLILAEDPGETQEVAAQHPEVVARL